LFMPEPRGICPEALSGLSNSSLKSHLVDIPVTARQEDSTAAARAMAEAGAGCIITLGGDGTNRAVFKGSGPEVPLLPVSTGTNNVFPEFQEGTMAGYAAGLIALGRVKRETACWHSKVLKVLRDGEEVDLALVDLAIATDSLIGARAIWNITHLSELFLTRAQPWSIGLSAIGGMVHPLSAEGPVGLHMVFGPEGRQVRAPIGPGLFEDVCIKKLVPLGIGERVRLNFERQVTLAFDGERDMVARRGDNLEVELSANGPWVVDTPRTMTAAVIA
ncbi:MAG TPA: NAD(+)/NADH kinase, partial [Chloroflexia bacterium]|nr:NAD(+)/NADH kinase [Chloroflexia bacterium]